MARAPDVGVAGRQHRRDRLPADRAAAQPDQRTQARRQALHVERFAGRERVEVAGEHVEPVLPRLHRPQQRGQLDQAAALGPGRVHGAQVDADDVDVVVLERQVEERVARQERPAPHRLRDPDARQEAERLAAVRPVLRQAGLAGERAHDVRPRRLLQHHHVRRAAADHRGDRLDAADAAVADVVGQQPQRHVTSGRSSSVSVSGFSSSVR